MIVGGSGTLETRNWQYGDGFAFNQMRNNSYAVRINGGTVRFTETTSAVRGFQVGTGGATLESIAGVTYTKLAGTALDENLLTGVTGGSLTLAGDGNGDIQDAIGTHGTWDPAAGLVKEGAGTWVLGGANTYAGATTINGGTLVADGDSVPDGSRVNINGSGKLQITELVDPVIEVVDTLYINGVQKAAGTYGASGSGAATVDDIHFSGAGVVQVTQGSAPASDYDDWAGSEGFNLAGGPEDDDDGDGMSNFDEYAFGLKPGDGSSVNPITVSLDKTAGTFTYTRRDNELTGLTYKVWTSSDLATWTEDLGATADDSAGPDGQGVESVVVTLGADRPLAAIKLFVRVSAESIPAAP